MTWCHFNTEQMSRLIKDIFARLVTNVGVRLIEHHRGEMKNVRTILMQQIRIQRQRWRDSIVSLVFEYHGGGATMADLLKDKDKRGTERQREIKGNNNYMRGRPRTIMVFRRLLPATIGPSRVALVGVNSWTEDDFHKAASCGIRSFRPDYLHLSSQASGARALPSISMLML